MEELNLTQAIKLYKLLKPYLPEKADTDLDYVKYILDKIVEANPRDYMQAVSLMSGKSLQDLIQLGSMEVLNLFAEGLSVNRIVSLRNFFAGLEANNA